MICDLIKGDYENYDVSQRFLFDIVSNKNNSFDLDKLDYINRDLFHTKINMSQIDYGRIIKNTRIINNKICYDVKIHNDINIVFQRRFELFKSCYLHKTCLSLDLMITDVLLQADTVYNFLAAIHDPEKYMHMNDELLRIIQKSRDPRLKASKELLTRIQKRDLYKQVDNNIIVKSKEDYKLYTEDKIIEQLQDDPEVSLKAGDVIV